MTTTVQNVSGSALGADAILSPGFISSDQTTCALHGDASRLLTVRSRCGCQTRFRLILLATQVADRGQPLAVAKVDLSGLASHHADCRGRAEEPRRAPAGSCGVWRGSRTEGFPCTSFLYLILELSQEERQQVLYCVVLAQDGREAHDDRGQSRLHMLVRVRHQFLEAAWRKNKSEP